MSLNHWIVNNIAHWLKTWLRSQMFKYSNRGNKQFPLIIEVVWRTIFIKMKIKRNSWLCVFTHLLKYPVTFLVYIHISVIILNSTAVYIKCSISFTFPFLNTGCLLGFMLFFALIRPFQTSKCLKTRQSCFSSTLPVNLLLKQSFDLDSNNKKPKLRSNFSALRLFWFWLTSSLLRTTRHSRQSPRESFLL